MSTRLGATQQGVVPGLLGESLISGCLLLSSVGKAEADAHGGDLLPLILLLRDQTRLFKQVFFNNSSVMKGKRKNKSFHFNYLLKKLESFATHDKASCALTSLNTKYIQVYRYNDPKCKYNPTECCKSI